MNKLFLAIYDFFRRRRVLLYALLGVSAAAMAWFAFQVRINEDVTSFFPETKGGGKTSQIYKNLKAKDKIFILVSGETDSAEPETLIEAGENYVRRLAGEVGETHIRSITASIDGDAVGQVSDFIYGHLPIFLTEKDYARIDSLLEGMAMDARMKTNYDAVVSAAGFAARDFILADPLGLGGQTLAGLQDFGRAAEYEVYEDHIFSRDLSTLVILIEPTHGMGSTGPNDALIDAIEETARVTEAEYEGVAVSYFGGPSVGVYNARQIKRDTMITLTVAFLIIVAFISVAFRSRWALLQIMFPVVYGGLFALACIYFIRGSMSGIAMGAGAAVFGIAMSYSIHVVSHRSHVRSVRRIVDELAYPLTVGSITTIGAFLGLLFTDSALLRDFGLFAALALVGTTFASLVFLPHMMRDGQSEKPSRILRFIERITAYPLDRNKWVVGGVLALLAVCLFFYRDVKFDSNMLNLSVEPRHIKEAEMKVRNIFDPSESRTMFVSSGTDPQAALESYREAGERLGRLKDEGLVSDVVSASKFLIPEAVQRERIERWNSFWTPEKRARVLDAAERSAVKAGFAPGAFALEEMLARDYGTVSATDPEILDSPLFREWVSRADSLLMLSMQVTLPRANKDTVYGMFMDEADAVPVDMGYFSNRMAVTVNDNFNLVLYICSILIFAALLVSYGRIELTLMTFMPMAVSWVIILGLMALFGIEFNIVNIILSTFVFGIGDDFSIFIMDGLLGKYRSGRRVLAQHKSAIFFSAITIIVGMGALVFAGHPALRSISVISILGLAAVVLTAFTLQPILFRAFISSQTRRGGFPYTLASLANTVYCFTYFVTGCSILQGVIVTLAILPISNKRKKAFFHRAVSFSTRTFLRTMITTRSVYLNPAGEDFKRPAVIVANHQSFIDILVMLSICPKMVMVTNGWVWRSPFFGRIVRYADFYHTADGYESLAETLRAKVADGYSVMVFPEGTRSPDMNIRRFHKGAFYLAEKLGLDIIPVVMFGNGLASSKRQPFYIKKSLLVSRILPRITPDDTAYGDTYTERARNIAAMFRREYGNIAEEYGTPDNPYYFDALMKNYTYKGPVLEWYMRVKVRMEGKYRFFHEIIPRNASVTDVGCGYGPLSFMLSMLSAGRRVLGVDYDEEKIAVAEHSFLRTDRVGFVCADAVTYDYPRSDVFVLNDVLHYMGHDSQRTLVDRCAARLNPGGMILIRDGDSDKAQRHEVTKWTEKMSTRVLGFNKTEGELHFTSGARIREMAAANGLAVEERENDRRTSNTIYILKKR